MSERTRLDEIVEEEYHLERGDSNRMSGAYRIAERAFRHGVEQSTHVDYYADAQPAPAEENWVKRVVGNGPPVDRRKGQRRKGLEERCPDEHGRVHWDLPDSPIGEGRCGRDRRSGQDRRKS